MSQPPPYPGPPRHGPSFAPPGPPQGYVHAPPGPGRSPLQPFGQAPRRPPGARPPGPPPPRRPRWLFAVGTVLVLALALGGMVWAASRDAAREAEEAQRRQSPTSAPASPIPTASADEIPFTSSEGDGVLKINSHRWSGTTIIVNLTVTSVSGDLTFEFSGWGPSGANVQADDAVAPDPAIGSGEVASGQSVTGNVALPVGNRGPVTLAMANQNYESVAALRIEP